MLVEDKPRNLAGQLITLQPGATVDLHMHSPASDGFWTPKTLPPAAAELGIKVLALTDHDEVIGYGPLADACRAYGIHVIPAAELSTYFNGIGFHMLAYNLDL